MFGYNIETGCTLRALGLKSIGKVNIVSGIYWFHILQPYSR